MQRTTFLTSYKARQLTVLAFQNSMSKGLSVDAFKPLNTLYIAVVEGRAWE
jgi:hypothetical protein